MHKHFGFSKSQNVYNRLCSQRREYGSPLTGRVLIVEDDHATQLLLEAVLEHESIEAERAGDGQTALQKLDERDFAAVILDLLMPRTDGFDVLRNVAARKPEILKRIIVITAAAESAWNGRPELKRVRCVLRKPLDIMEVAGHVHACIAEMSDAASDPGNDIPISHVSHG